MALNSRQTDFIARLKSFATKMESLYGEAHALKEAHAEEFDNLSDNSLLNATKDIEAIYFFDSSDVKTAVNQAVQNYINFWTGDAVGTREYGKDLRRIK